MEAIDSTAVVAYLRAHPQFFLDQPDLAMALELPRDFGRSTSLASYQLQVLRQQNKELEQRLTALVSVARENELLMHRVQMLAQRLFKSPTLAEAVRQLAASMCEDFQTDWVRIVLVGAPALSLHADWLIAAADGGEIATALAPLLASGEPSCGRLKPAVMHAVYGEAASGVQSAVFVPLHSVGALVIGSDDPNRFHPGMGTTFLKFIGELSETALAMRIEAQGSA